MASLILKNNTTGSTTAGQLEFNTTQKTLVVGDGTSIVYMLPSASYLTDSASFNSRIAAATNEQYIAGFATTSSLNTFTQSYTSDSASFSSRIAAATNEQYIAGFSTTASFNSFTQSYTSDSASFSSRIDAVNDNLITSASFNSYTQSTDNRITSLESKTGSYATTGSNTFIDNQIINANISASGWISASSINVTNATITNLYTIYETSSVVYSSGSNQLGDDLSDTQILSGSVKIVGALTINGNNVSTQSFVDLNSLNLFTSSQYVSNSYFATTSSLNTLSSSFYLDSASFNSRIAAATNEQYIAGFATTSSLNSFTQSYNLDSASFSNRIDAATNEIQFATTASLSIISASAWGAFQSASSYSGSLATSISESNYNITTNSASIGLLQTFSSSQYKNDSSSFDSRIDNLVLGAGAQLGNDNQFTGQNSFTQYITGSISGAVDGIDVRLFSSSVNSRINAIVGGSGFATTGSNTFNGSQNIIGDITASGNLYISGTIYTYELHTIIESSSVIKTSGSTFIGDEQSDTLTITGSLLHTGSTSFSELTGSLFSFSSSLDNRINTNISNITSLSSSIYQTNETQSYNISIISASAWGAFQSASSYSASLQTSISASKAEYTSFSASAETSISTSKAEYTSFSASTSTSLNTLSSSIYQTDATQSNNIGIVSASTWGAFQSASSYSASFYTTIDNLSSSNYQTNVTQSSNIAIISASAWGAFQSASSYSASLQTSISASNATIVANSSSVYNSISASNAIITSNSSSVYTSISASSAVTTLISTSVNSRLLIEEFKSTTFATTGSNTFNGNQIISGSLNVTGDVVAYSPSDERLKDNIQLISNPIEKVQQLRGVEFDWKDGLPKAGQHEYGVIAQDVLKVMPHLVQQRPDGYYGVQYEKIVTLLIEVVKDQEKRIKILENRLNQ